ncbi:MAG: hypothetical protein JWR08_2236 [Enterovirga sp.]|nr:hypothetical protein [Enterovirga sp.]
MPRVIATRGDGLGSRLLAALHGRVLAEALGFELAVIWPKLGGLPLHDAKTIFDPEHRAELFYGDALFDDTGPLRGHFTTLEAQTVPLKGAFEVAPECQRDDRSTFLARLGPGTGLLYNHPNELFPFVHQHVAPPAAWRRAWDAISWSDRVHEAVAAVSGAAGPRYLAVHVRRGDILEMLHKTDLGYLAASGMAQILQRYLSLETIFGKLEAIRGTETIVVCSEDSDVQHAFAARFDRVVSSRLDAGLTDAQRAAVDLVLLSRAATIVTANQSYFGRCAATGGRCTEIALELDFARAIPELLEATRDMPRGRAEALEPIMYRAAARLLLVEGNEAGARDMLARADAIAPGREAAAS